MKKFRQTYTRLFAFILIIIALSSCRKVVIKIDHLPSNTPVSADIFVTGNFNMWDPGDNRYKMTLLPDSSYAVDMPLTIGRVEFKITRGNWSTVEQNQCGYAIENHYFNGRPKDTIHLQVESWADLDPVDCDSVTIVLDKIPSNLKPDEKIKIAGNFNAWNPGNKKEYEVKTDPASGKKFVTISRKANKNDKSGQIQYLFVRDTVAIPEVDKFGRDLGSRLLQLERGDTVSVSIDNWKDKVTPTMNQVTIILTKVPENTPASDNIYLVGNFNDWLPGDPKYKFSRQADGTWKINIPRLKYGLSFKITRGQWDTEFSDECGNKFGNQDYNYDDIDTLHIEIRGWIDRIKKPERNLVFIIDQLPENTPADAEIFMAADANGWNPQSKNYQFEKRNDGRWYLEKSRSLAIWNYKITRGDWFTKEVTKNGLPQENHWFNKDCADTVKVKIEAWNDLFLPGEPITTIILTTIPEKNHDRTVFLVGEFNNWQPGQQQFALTPNDKGQLSISVPSRWLHNGFKFTQGGWERVETNRKGGDIDNRFYMGTEKTLELQVEGWKR